MIITIDGTAGSGKGTLAKSIAKELNCVYLDTGLLYRAVAKSLLQNNIDPKNQEQAIKHAQNLDYSLLESKDLRTEEVSNGASIVASIGEVRTALLEYQRNFSKNLPKDRTGVVLDGRDTGSVVCPDADVKFFIDIPVETRARRRVEQYTENNIQTNYDEILQTMKERDARDASRDVAPMIAPKNALILKDPTLTIEETKNLALNHIKTTMQ